MIHCCVAAGAGQYKECDPAMAIALLAWYIIHEIYTVTRAECNGTRAIFERVGLRRGQSQLNGDGRRAYTHVVCYEAVRGLET